MSKLVRNGLIGLAALLLPLSAAASSRHHVPAVPAQAALDSFAADAGYRFTIVSNKGDQGQIFRIDLTTPKTLPKGRWAIYMSLVEVIKSADSDAFDLKNIDGDVYVLTPKTAIRPGATYAITLHGDGHFYSKYYVLPNAFVTGDGLKPRIIAASRAAVDADSGLETLPFVAPMTDEAALATTSDGDATRWLTPERAFDQNAGRAVAAPPPEFGILPTPLSARHLDGAPLDFSHGVRVGMKLGTTGDEWVRILPAVNAFAYAAHDLSNRVKGLPVDISVGPDYGKPESYSIHADAAGIVIKAGDDAGASYALRSLAQEIAYEHGSLRPLEISDAPRFPFRGLHLDLARNFESKPHILAIIEQMASLKLNRLHLHLGDDEGWRLAIDGLPELTDIGSKRCFDLAENTCLLPELGAGPDNSDGGTRNGYLSRADYIEILKAARARNIEVIPSFDMPGHSRAAVRSMEARARRLIAAGKPGEAAQYRLQDPDDTTVYSSVQHYSDNTLNICEDSTYAFIAKVIDDIKSMHDEAGLPLKVYHIGTDETAGAWTDSPACRRVMAEEHMTEPQLATRFITKVSQMLAGRGIEPAGWSDGMGSADPAQMPAKVQSNSWGSFFAGGIQDAYKQANQGWDIVMSTPDVLYFDMPWAPDPEERGYDWASRGTDLYKIFAFMPENLGANISLMTDTQGHGGAFADTAPLNGAGHITGMQGQLWSETVRSDAIADYMLYPRVEALAERAWHRASWEPAYIPGKGYTYGDGSVDVAALDADWQDFNARLAARLPMLDQAGVAYRLPPPGARITGGKLQANVAYGGLDIDYQTGDKTWQRYQGEVTVQGPVRLRTVSPDGKRFSRTVRITP